MVALVIIVADEGFDLVFQISWQKVVLQQDAILERLMPPFDFALGLRMIGRTARVRHALVFQVFCQLTRYVAGPIV